MNDNLRDAFSGLDDAFGTEYKGDGSLEKAERNAERFTQLAEKKAETLEDKEYMQFELKTLISETRRVLDVLDQDLKIGAQPRTFEVYATLTQATLAAIKELRSLHTDIERIKLSKEKIKSDEKLIGNVTNNVTMSLSGKELFNMIKEAEKNSMMKEIEAEFDIEGVEYKKIKNGEK